MKKIVFILIIISSAACNDPRSEYVPTMAAMEDEGRKKEFGETVAKLSDEEKGLLRGYMLRSGFAEKLTGEVPPRRTVAEAIEDQRTFLEEKAAKEEEKNPSGPIAQMKQKQKEKETEKARSVVSLVLLSKENVSMKYGRERIEFAFIVANNTEREMTGVKGAVTFVNTFGEKIMGPIGLTIEEKIPAAGTIEHKGNFQLNQFMGDHQALKNADVTKLGIVFKPDAVIYADGEKVSIP